MQTFLDAYIIEYALAANTVAKNYRIGKLAPSPLRTTIAGLGLALIALEQNLSPLLDPSKDLSAIFDNNDTSRTAIMILLLESLLTVLHPIGFDPLCLKVTRELANAFAGKKTVDSDEVFSLVRDRGAVYIDIPHNTYLVGGQYELRAIILKYPKSTVAPASYHNNELKFTTLDSVNIDDKFSYMAICTERGTNKMLGYFEGMTGTPDSGFGFLSQGINVDILRKQVVELIKLFLLYFTIAPAGSQRTVIQVDAEGLCDRKKRRQFEREKKFTMFDVIEIGTTSDDTVFQIVPAGQGGSRAGWRLDHKIEIDAYYQRKWKGKQGQRYCELVQVSGHSRGPDEEKRTLPLYNMNPID